MIGTGQTPALRFAVEGDADAAVWIIIRRAGQGEAIGKGKGERQGAEFTEEALQRRLVRRDAIAKAKRRESTGNTSCALN